MKRYFISWCLTLLAVVTMSAQQIAVVKGDVTNVYQTLAEAIDGAESGSFIYLPGGSFPISDEVKITKQLYIMGIGYSVNSDHADGCTIIAGNLYFKGGSSGSFVMGCYLNGDVVIGEVAEGEEPTIISDVMVKLCNINAIIVNDISSGAIINQNYIRSTSAIGGTNSKITNNIFHSVNRLNNSMFENNIVVSKWYSNWRHSHAIYDCNNSIITNNIIMDRDESSGGSNCQITGNLVNESYGDNCIVMSNWGDIFVNYVGLSPNSNFHFKEAYKEYEDKVGIHAGTGFSDSGLPPVPYIVEKDIPEQTDASGKLNIKIKVKTGE